MPFRASALAFLLVVLACPPVLAQERDPAPPAPNAQIVAPLTPAIGRNRIGLALAGGAAFGEAHIGVLRWLEEHHIPVDYVAGTSMGGLVGGAYASGYAPGELEQLLTRLDWQDALRGDTPYPALSFRRKEDRRVIPNRFNFGLKKGLTLPGGLNPAHAIGLLLSEIAYPVSLIDSFDNLPIPFRCVATDLQTGESVVMKDGSLAVALRATMSLPGIFTPVTRDGRLLTDGGIAQNLPTEVVRDMGAQTIIAVDLGASGVRSDTKTELESVLSIIGRSASLAVRANERASLKIADVVITPDLSELTGTDFARVSDFEKRGYAAAEAQKAALLPLAIGETAWATYLAARQARRGNRPGAPTFLAVVGPTGERARRIVRQLRPLLFKPFPSGDADDRFTLLTGTGRYNAVLYEGVRNIEGQSGVQIRAQETDYGPPFLRAGLEINGADTRSVQVNLVTRYIGFDAGVAGAESRVDASIGSVNRLTGEYLLPVFGGATSPLFVAPRAFAADNSRNVFVNGTRTAVFGTQEIGVGLDAVLIPNRFAQFRGGYQLSRFQSALQTGTANTPRSGNVETLQISGIFDGLDDAILPRNGSRVSLFGTRYNRVPGNNQRFDTAIARWDVFITKPKSRDTLFGLASGGTSFGAGIPAPLQFSLGGPFRLGSESVDSLRGDNFFVGTGGVLRTVSTPPLLGGRTLVGLWGEVGGVSGNATVTGLRGSLTGALISETFLGPVLLGVSMGDNGRGGVRFLPYFVLGRLF